MIRYILEPKHLEIQSSYPKPYYTSYHSFYDKEIAPPDEKLELYKYLKQFGFDTELYMIKIQIKLMAIYQKFRTRYGNVYENFDF